MSGAHRGGTASDRPRRPCRPASLVALLLALVTLAACQASGQPQASPTVASSSSPSPTTSAAPTVAVGTTEHALEVDGRVRVYRLYRPAGISAAAPLVVMLHGGLGTASRAEQAYGWNEIAEREKVLVAYPDAVGEAWNVGGDCCGIAATQGVNDVKFLTRVVDDIESQMAVDPKRIYTTGMSNGGMMAYRFACETDLLAAIGPVAATMLGDCPNPAPMSVMAINGTADQVVPYTGGSSGSIVQINGPPVPDVIRSWRTTARCGGEVISVDGAVTTSVARCPNDRTVKLVTITGGGHEWQGVQRTGPLDASPAATAPVPSTTTAGTVDATEDIWAFFASHHR